MGSYLVKVRKKMTIYARQKTRNILEGEYGSVFKGRSMDFDDLRTYIPGDDVKDIDWKATARSGQVLIRRYIAIRKHNILLLVDTGKNMAASSGDTKPKRDISIMTAGAVSYIAQKHGDLIALVAGDAETVQYMPLKGTTPHIERVLKHIDEHTSLQSARGSMERLFDYVARTIRRRMIIVVISDVRTLSPNEERLLRRLCQQHEVMFVGVDDIDPSDSKLGAYELDDLETSKAVPRYMRRHAKLHTAYTEAQEKSWKATTSLLERLRISSVRIAREQDVIPQLIVLLERKKHARR